MVLIGGIIFGLAVLAGTAFSFFETGQMERAVHENALDELKSLKALIVSAMARRLQDPESVGVAVFNDWFGQRNHEYAGLLWSVWSPKVAEHMHATEPTIPTKLPKDATDREALDRGEIVGRFVDGDYRLSLPIRLGVTAGADQEACFTCHEAMGLKRGDVIAVLSTRVSIAEEQANLRDAILKMIVAVAVVTVLILLGIRAALVRSITSPIGDMTQTMTSLAGGDTAIAIPHTTRADEVGAMAKAIAVFKDNALRADALARERERDQQYKENRARVIDRLIVEFNGEVTESLGSMLGSLATMEATATALSVEAGETATQSLVVSESTRRASEGVQTVAAASEEMTASIGEISAQVGRAAAIVQTAIAGMNTTTQRVRGLTEAVGQIGEVVQMITNIASQTNLLALNATIEAARAGEAGRGFAVVASEVKNLSGQTAHATERITRQIEGVRAASDEAVKAIASIAETVQSIDAITAVIVAAITEQDTTTREISRASQEAATGAAEVCQSIELISRATVATESHAEQVHTDITSLESVSKDLRDKISSFLGSVRVA
ncbi:MAG: HAMP domain-containing methyl-accepting chemotaxis protein [Rhodospirillaceae bacterium]